MSSVAFPLKLNRKNGSLDIVETDDSIKQSIMIILLTQVGERIGNLEFGTDLNRFMFESITDFLIEEMKAEIRKSILRFEKRVDELEVEINQVNNSSVLKISISYVNTQSYNSNIQSLDFNMDLNDGIIL